MSKVELSLDEYNDLLLSQQQALADKLELKRACITLSEKYIKMIAKYLTRDASVWTHAFKEDVAITKENFKDYISFSVVESNDFTEEELYLAVKELYNGKFNKR